mmetsp:Transcript_1797/g.2990  ORF Transcript_1797/g.2990 Transcript_1797/m.2990 type:complete len:316 (+) Transcript_1797:4066-5013(+)
MVDPRTLLDKLEALPSATKEKLQTFLCQVQTRNVKTDDGSQLHIVYNENRRVKKRKGGTNDGLAVINAVNPEAFNFQKVKQEEILIEVDDIKFLLNLFPIYKEHFIVCSALPLPQHISGDKNSRGFLRNVLKTFVLGGFVTEWILVFNTFGALASVNHLHMQILERPCHRLYLENNKQVSSIKAFTWGNLGILISQRVRWLVFDLVQVEQLETCSNALAATLQLLAEKDIAHNFVSLNVENAILRIAVIPRRDKIVADPDKGADLGILEMLGCVVVSQDKLFREFSQQHYEQMHDGAALPHQEFNSLLEQILLVI